LNASDKGGASIVAQRLNEALNAYTNVNSHHLIFSGNSKGFLETTFWANSPLKKIRAFLNHALDKFDFLRYERNAEIRFQFNHARMGIDISNHPLILEADIIHIHWVLRGFLSFETLEKLFKVGKPIVWTCHDFWPFTGGCFHPRDCDGIIRGCGRCPYLINSEQNDSSLFWLNQKLGLIKKNLPIFVFPSKWVLKEINKGGAFNEIKRTKVISNPININVKQSLLPIEKKALKKVLGLKEDRFTLLFSAANVNNLSKGFLDFIKIVQLLEHLPIQILIMGYSTKPVHFKVPYVYTGYLNNTTDISDCYLVSDLFITTSREETFGMTIAESMSYYLPVLGYNVGAIPEIIKNNLNGYIFNVGEVVEMAKKTEELINNPNRLKQLSENARSFVVENFDESIVANHYLSLYNDVIMGGIN